MIDSGWVVVYYCKENATCCRIHISKMSKSIMSSSHAWTEVACSQNNVDENDVVCWINITWIDLDEVEVVSWCCVLDKQTMG